MNKETERLLEEQSIGTAEIEEDLWKDFEDTFPKLVTQTVAEHETPIPQKEEFESKLKECISKYENGVPVDQKPIIKMLIRTYEAKLKIPENEKYFTKLLKVQKFGNISKYGR